MSVQPDWLLERAAVGEAPAEFDPDPAALEALRVSSDEILEALPPRTVAAEVEHRVRARRQRRTRVAYWSAGAALATAAVLLFALTRGGDETRLAGLDPAELDGGTRIKGGLGLILHQKRGDEAVRLAPRARAGTGDLLQLSYVAAGRGFGVIVSIDGRGTTTLHFPDTPEASTALAPGKATPLAHAYRLDDAPRFERFFLVASSQPIDVAAVIRASERLAAMPRRESAGLELGPDLEQVSFLVTKLDSP